MKVLSHIGIALIAVIGAAWTTQGGAAEMEATYQANVPVRAITQGPKAHWFGYYDKHQFDPTGRYVLGMEVDFEGRTPTPDDVVVLGMVDIEDGDRWIPFAESRAWSWQQGCMLQWMPGSNSEVIYNDRDGDQFISVIQDVFTGEKRRLPKAIYAVSPDGKRGVGTNFARIDDTRPGYGYKGGVDPGAGELCPEGLGIYTLDLETGAARTVISLDRIAAIPQNHPTEGRHWFNHLLWNTDGTRFIFLHRAYRRAPKKGGWVTRMFTANADGSGLHCVADHGMVSHFIWKNPKQILAWSIEPEGTHFHLYDDQTETKTVIGEDILKHDGHCTYSPDGTWVLTDTYPNRDRMQTQLLYRPSDNKVVELGKFYLSPQFKGEFRCDLHARWDRLGKYVCLDSMHGGDQRQMYLLDVGGVTGLE